MWGPGARLLLVTAVLGPAVVAGQSTNSVAPDRYCLSCLCVASSDCDFSTECREVGGRSFCGPFYMTEHFWLDSNVTGLPQFSGYDYQTCARDTACAGEAVTRYLSKHATDCDGDGRITCKDFGLTHLLGHIECHDRARQQDAETTRFVTRFVQCLLDTLGLLNAGENVQPTCVRRQLSVVSLQAGASLL